MSEDATNKKSPYLVLARKYRPQNFEELIGQDALVRTLKNAIESGRIAHAFMLTGVRGVGKTTTARIIAKALNYAGPDGTSGATTGDTADCPICRAISEDRHPDVMEMDAASRTGVDDIREILDGVRYAPSEARYKIYIIDEVHMLSKNAFNALLKTLEEPPEHVKFIFATTEIRKVPVTVLSRCQRFDLRRVDAPTLQDHFKNICTKEDVTAQDEALGLVARAADGSVRDGLSILDQAIALGGGNVDLDLVQDMLGLADRARSMDLLDNALAGDMPGALGVMDDLYKAGADPLVVIQDLLELTHNLSKLRAAPAAGADGQMMSPDMLARASEMAAKLSMPALGKAWNILLKGVAEVQNAPVPQAAAEMVIIRLGYAANLPDPKDLIKKIESGQITAAQGVPSGGGAGMGNGGGAPAARFTAIQGGGQAMAVAQSRAEPQNYGETALWQDPLHSLEDVVEMFDSRGEPLLAQNIKYYVHLVKISPRNLEIRIADGAPKDLHDQIRKGLRAHTGDIWMITIPSGGSGGAATLAQQDQARWDAEVAEVKLHPFIAPIIEAFPETEIKAIKKPK